MFTFIHDNPLFRKSPYWKDAFGWLLDWDCVPGVGVIIGVFSCGIVVFFSCIMIEKMRQHVIKCTKRAFSSIVSYTRARVK